MKLKIKLLIDSMHNNAYYKTHGIYLRSKKE